jgi:hypothetical protein
MVSAAQELVIVKVTIKARRGFDRQAETAADLA